MITRRNQLDAPRGTTQQPWMIMQLMVVMAWLFYGSLLSGRAYYLLPYAVTSSLTPNLEPFGVRLAALPILIGLALLWLWLARCAIPSTVRQALIYLSIAVAPLCAWLMNVTGVGMIRPTFIEPVWLSAWTGMSFGTLASCASLHATSSRQPDRRSTFARLAFIGVTLICAVWWFSQSCWYYDSFLLGYNDFGHFLQRLSNTLHGQGWLIESPALPRFWDHFNPGLLMLLPLWSLWPDVHQAFLWQAFSLVISAYLINRIAQTLGHSRRHAAIWGIAWLVQPALGQMNLAYTYGWHPISMAVPLLLTTIWSLLLGRWWAALLTCLAALSIEEGVFVIVSLTALCCGGLRLWRQWRTLPPDNSAASQRVELSSALSTVTWLAVGVLAAVAFVLIYKFSGLAEFQTGRFAKLGSNTSEILLSPIQRPHAFWGAWLSFDRWCYLLLLALPCCLPALIRGWYYLLPTLLPLFVLGVWDHPPAHCLAFQYASTLLPMIWLAALSGSLGTDPLHARWSRQCATTACVTGLVLSIFIGQLPYSGYTLLDVDGKTYGVEDGLRRQTLDEDCLWLKEQLGALRTENATCLTTGRIAAHLVGVLDIETVGQFIERRQALSKLPGRAIPIRHYQWIVLDRLELFQQPREQTQLIEAEARSLGYTEVAVRYDIVILKRPD